MSSKLQLDRRYHKSVVAPTGEVGGMVLFAGNTV